MGKCLQRYLWVPEPYYMFTNDMLFMLEDVDVYSDANDNTFVCSGYDYDFVMNKYSIQCDHVV